MLLHILTQLPILEILHSLVAVSDTLGECECIISGILTQLKSVVAEGE